MIFHKGRDSHDYKYGAALSEEFLWSTEPRWRRPDRGGLDLQLPGRQDARQPAHEARARPSRRS